MYIYIYIYISHGGNRTSAHITPLRPLPGDSGPLGAINTAATTGGDEIHSRGGGRPVPRTDSPFQKQNPKNPREKISCVKGPRFLVANHLLGLIFSARDPSS